MSWVNAKSGHAILSKEIVDVHFGVLFYEIRFGSMTITEFSNLSEKYGSVLSYDFQAITKLIARPDCTSNKFNTHRRQIKWTDDDGTTVKCDRVNFEDFI